MDKTTQNFQVDPTKRFSNRVEYYIKYRPSYPSKLLDVLENKCGLNRVSIIADIGSGTGFLSELFLRNKNTVFGVEPNKEMREAAEKLFTHYSNFISVDGAAEETTLPGQSVDFVTAGQAFHWFDVQGSRKEFVRILKPEGWVVLVWNDRKIDSTPFLIAYEKFLHKWGTDYGIVQQKTFDQNRLKNFFGHEQVEVHIFKSSQLFDLEGLKGRVLSSSYMPAEDHPNYKAMLNALNDLFEKLQVGGKVTFEYETKMFLGQLTL